MEHVNRTLSLPKDVDTLLRTKIPSGRISQYVANAVREAFARDEQKNQRVLEAAYEEAEKDLERRKVINELEVLDNLNDIKGWEW
jgi:hypothetical protein